MSSANPKVSIVIPVYNMASYVGEAISSALDQSFNDLEVIVVDDGSTDETPDIARSFDDRVRYLRLEHSGVANAMNAGIAASHGEYVNVLDADDTLCPDATRTEAQLLDANPNVGFVYGRTQEVDADGRPLRIRNYPKTACGLQHSRQAIKRLLRGNVIVSSTVMFRRSCFEESGGFRQQCVPGEDWGLWLRMLAHHDIICSRRPIARYRIHGESLTAGFNLSDYEASHSRILRNLFEGGEIGRHNDLRDYAYAAHLRSLARLAAWHGEMAASRRFLRRAVRLYPKLAFEGETWGCVYYNAKAALPEPLVRAGKSIRDRLSSVLHDR